MSNDTITEEQRNAVFEALQKRYGEQGEDWDAVVVTVKGTKRIYAVKAPKVHVWKQFQRDLADSERSKRPNLDLDLNVAVDCLITDVDGCSGIDAFKQDAEIKVALPAQLGRRIGQLVSSGFEDLKKG